MVTNLDVIKIIRDYYGYKNITILDEDNFVDAFIRFHKMATKYFNANMKSKPIINKRYWDEINASSGTLKSLNDVVSVTFI